MREESETIGSCAIDVEKRLLRFDVTQERSSRSGMLLRLVQNEHGVEQVMVGTLDPYTPEPPLDGAESVSPHSLSFTYAIVPTAEATAVRPACPAPPCWRCQFSWQQW